MQLSSELFDSSKFLPPDSSQDPIFPPALRVSDMYSSDGYVDVHVIWLEQYFQYWRYLLVLENWQVLTQGLVIVDQTDRYWHRHCHCWLNWQVLTQNLVIVNYTGRFWQIIFSRQISMTHRAWLSRERERFGTDLQVSRNYWISNTPTLKPS